jgi:cytoskeletal protein RodZ
MGQEVRGDAEAAALTGAAPADASIGVYLARQRRLRGVTLDELANLTKIPLRSLERLEAGVFDQTPDGFVRGFVRTVADALGLDPDDAVNRLLCEPREDAAHVRSRLRERRRQAIRRAALAAAAVVVAFALWRVSLVVFGRDGAADAPLVYRHDAVRALADEESR